MTTHGVINKGDAGKMFKAEFPQATSKAPARKLVKGSPQAKQHMAKLRKMQGKR